MSHASDRAKLKAQKKEQRDTKMRDVFGRISHHTYRVLVLVLAGALMFAGVMSLVQADPVIRYTIAAVVVFFVSKELY